MTTALARIRSIPDRYRARMREIVRAYTLVNERDEDWVDEFHAHGLATRSEVQPAPEAPPAAGARPLAARPPCGEARRRSELVATHRR